MVKAQAFADDLLAFLRSTADLPLFGSFASMRPTAGAQATHGPPWDRGPGPCGGGPSGTKDRGPGRRRGPGRTEDRGPSGVLVVRTMDRVKSTDRLAPSTERRRSTSHRLSVPLCAALSCAPAPLCADPQHARLHRAHQAVSGEGAGGAKRPDQGSGHRARDSADSSRSPSELSSTSARPTSRTRRT